MDLLPLFFFKNTILISAVFWGLTLFGQLFIDRVEYFNREDFYECGFKTTVDVNFSLNFGFFFSAIFVIIYDLELVLLIPFLFNHSVLSWSAIFSIVFFLSVVFFSFIIDILFYVVDWNY